MLPIKSPVTSPSKLPENLSFAVMVIFAVVDLATGYLGKDLVINEFIYNSFVLITLGSLGIAGAEKIFGSRS